jgi:hypothetical protein
VKDFITVTAPLNQLTKKGVQFEWGAAQQNAFDELKGRLINGALLALPDFSKQFEIACDASGLGIGSVLMQEGRPIAYFSEKLNGAQLNLRTGPIIRARGRLLEQQVNSLLTEYNLFTNENFILPKSLHVCMIRFVAEASMTRGGEELHEDNHKMVPIISESTREERKAGAPPLKKKS